LRLFGLSAVFTLMLYCSHSEAQQAVPSCRWLVTDLWPYIPEFWCQTSQYLMCGGGSGTGHDMKFDYFISYNMFWWIILQSWTCKGWHFVFSVAVFVLNKIEPTYIISLVTKVYNRW